MSSVAILGSGAWGTALAIHLCRQSADQVVLWARDPSRATSMQTARVNEQYLPNHPLPNNLRVSHDLTSALSNASIWVIAVPSTSVIELIDRCMDIPGATTTKTWIVATKGLLGAPCLGKTPTDIMVERGIPIEQIAVLSGACFADELASGLFSSMICASKNSDVVDKTSTLFEKWPLKILPSTDITGLQWSAIYKNIAAVASGIIVGLGHGHNAQAWLIVQALAEMKAVVTHLGGLEATCDQLGGLGDLVLTTTGSLSRNRRLGQLIATGMSVSQAQTEIGQVTEGVSAVRILHQRLENGLDLPILNKTLAIVEGTAPVDSILPTDNSVVKPAGDVRLVEG